jgi:hypothetical protein
MFLINEWIETGLGVKIVDFNFTVSEVLRYVYGIKIHTSKHALKMPKLP